MGDTVMNKALAPLITALVLALFSGLSTGVYNYAEIQTAFTGVLVFGVVYLLKYAHERVNRPDAPTYYKFIASVVLPLLVGIVSVIQTGDFNNPEIQLLILSLVGGAWTWFAKYRNDRATPAV